MGKRHNVFISFHHENDEKYKIKFEQLFSDIYDILETKAVGDDDIDPTLPAETIRQIIRDKYIRSASVTVVLIGKETWKRKHVDWEISSSIRATKKNSRTGLLGIFLPSHPDFEKEKFIPYTIPPRLYYNVKCNYATLYDWNKDPTIVQKWIHKAFLRREEINPDNSLNLFGRNRTGEHWAK